MVRYRYFKLFVVFNRSLLGSIQLGQVPVRYAPDENGSYNGIPVSFVDADPAHDRILIGYTPIGGDISFEQIRNVALTDINIGVNVPYYHVQIDNQTVNFISINDVPDGYTPIGYEPYYR